jgi:dTDP-4-amino-4,6-dideoxygalactose transaminase
MPIFEATHAPAQIPQTDPGAFYRQRRSETLAAMARVLDSGWYVLGEEVRAFEQEFARHAGLAHAIGVSSGTDAVALALRALGVARGDRVATVSHTAVATVAAIEMIGARPVFIDISPGSFLLEAEPLAEALAVMPPVKALVVVHLYGQAADVPAIAAVAARYGARVVEDCAQAHGASWHGRPVGSMGEAGSFSFYPTKNLGALGDAGMVVTADSEVAAQLRMLREYGWQQRYVSETSGINSRLDEVQAAVLRLRLPFLADSNRRRAAIAAAYDRGLAHTGLPLPAVRPGACHVYHQYVIRHAQRERLRARLAEQGILTNVHYPVPVHLQPAYRRCCDIAPGGLPHTEAAAREVLSLPMYAELEDGAVERVIDTIGRLL